MADERYTVEFRSDGAARVAKNVRKIGTNAKTTTKSLLTMKNALVALATGLAAREIVRAGDAWTGLTNKIKIVTKSEKDLIRVREDLLAISRRTRSSVKGNATLFQRLAMANRSLGKSEKEVLKFTEAVSQSLAITGATSQETLSTLTQLSQGLGSVAVRGEEFRAVTESAPRLMKALQDATGLTTGALKDLTAQGKFLSQDFFEAVMSQSEALRRDFAKTASTFSQVGAVFKNLFEEIVGKFAVDTGIFSFIAEGLLDLADSIRANIDKAVAQVVRLKDALDNIKNTRGIGAALAEAGMLAGDLFMEAVFSGFELLYTVVADLGTILAQSAIKAFKDDGKNIFKDLYKYTSGAGLIASKILDKDKREAPIRSFNAGEFRDNFAKNREAYNKNITARMDKFFKKNEDVRKDFVKTQDMFTQMLNLGDEATAGNLGAESDLLTLLDTMSEKGGVFKEFFTDFSTAFNEMNKSAGSFATIMATTVTESIRGASDELAKFIVTGTADFKSLAQSIIQDLISIMIQKQLTNAVGGIGGVLGFTSTSTPQNQFGGPVQANTPTMVGERGPELFVPQSAGKIMTNAQSSGGGDSKQPRIINIFDSDAAFKSVTPSTQAEITMNFVRENSLALSGTLA